MEFCKDWGGGGGETVLVEGVSLSGSLQVTDNPTQSSLIRQSLIFSHKHSAGKQPLALVQLLHNVWAGVSVGDSLGLSLLITKGLQKFQHCKF